MLIVIIAAGRWRKTKKQAAGKQRMSFNDAGE
jgi:hypothetical protein